MAGPSVRTWKYINQFKNLSEQDSNTRSDMDYTWLKKKDESSSGPDLKGFESARYFSAARSWLANFSSIWEHYIKSIIQFHDKKNYVFISEINETKTMFSYDSVSKVKKG